MPVVASMKQNTSDTDASVQRTDSQRSQSNGPRVSFNKDVHVKKIGRRLSDPSEVSYHPNIRRELPSDLSAEALRKEAALVLSQAQKERANRPTNGPTHQRLSRTSSDPKRRKEDQVKNRFGSLPSRSNNKALGRSSSDASSKKSKRPSIFNFFQLKKNEYNFEDEEKTENNNNNPVPAKKVTRSKSDVGSGGVTRENFRKSPRRKSDLTEEVDKKNPQLSPIIEDTNRDDYFEEEQKQEKPKTFFGDVSRAKSASPSKKLIETEKKTFEEDFADAVKAFDPPAKKLKSPEKEETKMHSSQLPPEKPILTKGMKVPSMVKRLSMEKLSPPPTGVKAFSYLSPRASPGDEDRKIVYAEVVHNTKNDEKRDFKPKPEPEKLTIDEPDFSYNAKNYYDDDDFDLVPNKQTPAERFAAKYKTAISYSNENLLNVEEDDFDRIKPSIRDLPPEKPPINPWELGRRGQADGKEYYPEFNELSNRREELYSRIKSRINSVPRETVVTTRTTITTTNGVPPVRRNLSRELLDTVGRETEADDMRKKYSSAAEHGKSLLSNGHKSSRTETRTETRRFQNTYDDSNDDSSAVHRYTVTRTPLREPSPKREVLGANTRDTSRGFSKERVTEKKSEERFGTNSLGRKKKHQTTFGMNGLNDPKHLMTTCEKFLKRERRHTDESSRSQYLHRERSIDDGSRFDPRIDKYEVSTIDRKHRNHTIDEKSDKRFGSLGRMKQLLMGTNSRNTKPKKNNENIVPNSQELLVSDEEMRSRYREYRGPSTAYERENVIEVQEIANRRRLSTPRSSPIVHREAIRNGNDEQSKQTKTSWFKSLDRLSRKSKGASKENLLNGKKDRSVSPLFKRSKSPGKQKLRFFGDSDMEQSFSKGKTTTKVRKSTPFTLTKSNKVYSKSAFNLNATETPKDKKRDEYNRSASLYDLDKTNQDRKMRHRERHSRSRELQNISEDISTSENEHHTLKNHRKYGSDLKLKKTSRGHSSSSERNVPLKADYSTQRTRQHHSVDSYDDESRYLTRTRDRSHERQSMSPLRYNYEQEMGPKGSGDYRKPPMGPPKPARSFVRQKEMDRIHDSSGTEGDLSQHSVVYLHATTVGDIPPQSYIPPSRSASKSASRSRDDLSYATERTDGKHIEPMTKTVSRSVSMLAPWRPKHKSEGYEIDYSKRQTRKYVVPATSTTLPKQHRNKTTTHNGRTNGYDKKYPTIDRKYRAQDEFTDTTYRSGYDIDPHRRYRDSPVGGYNHHSKVMI
ncbi:uncharacterized protein LOC134831188 [Culicoides brevitarsis]|uniref:uncharacterized protein LOC134831188 n=1 Tax=Culicoides brevitarsis TaxID=469753 RepID=UPI00307BB6F3